MAIGIGIGLPFIRVSQGASIDPQAQAHFNRVIADGGIVPAGIDGINNYVKALKSVKGGSLSTMLSGYEPHYLGLKLATGVGATAGNRAAAKVYNLVGAIGDQVQTNAANQPLALVHSGTHYTYLSGVNDNFFATPNNVNNQITDDFGLEFIGTRTNDTNNKGLMQKGEGSGNNYTANFLLLSSRVLRIQLRTTIDNVYNSTVATNTNAIGYRVSRNATTGVIKFFETLNGTTWSQVGSDITGVTGTLNNANLRFLIGSISGTQTFIGICNSARIFKDDNFTTATQIFNPTSYNRATSQSTWTSTTGEVWTLNTANTNNALKAAIVDRTMIMGNGTTYGMQAASLNMVASAMSSYTLFRKFVNTSGGQIITELGAGVDTADGFSLAINFSTNYETIRINANIGLNDTNYSQNNLGLKLATGIYNIAFAIECQPYLVNNVSATFISQNSILNNTAAMNGTGYNLLASNNASSAWANAIFCGDLVFSGEDDATTRTAMYNAIKTFTNGI